MRIQNIRKVGIYLGRIVRDPFLMQSRAAFACDIKVFFDVSF